MPLNQLKIYLIPLVDKVARTIETINVRCGVSWQGFDSWGPVWVGLDEVWLGHNLDFLLVRAECFARLGAPKRGGRLTLLTAWSNQSIAALIQQDLNQPTQTEKLTGKSCAASLHI